MVCEIDMLACAAQEDLRSKRDELMQREEARLAALAVFDARIGKYDRLLDGLSYRDHDEQVIAVRIGYTRIKFTAEKFHGYATEPSIADVKRDLAEMCIDTTAAKAKVLAAVRETGK